MATIRVRCPTCNAELEVDSRHEGEEVECGSCLQVFTARRPKPRSDRDEPRKPRRSRRGRDDDDDGPIEVYIYEDAAPRGGGAAATFAVIFGVLALFLGCCPFTGIGFGAAAMWCGSMGAKNPHTRGLAITGSVLGSIGLVLGFGSLVWFIATNGR